MNKMYYRSIKCTDFQFQKDINDQNNIDKNLIKKLPFLSILAILYLDSKYYI